jgi:hypothetical protein
MYTYQAVRVQRVGAAKPSSMVSSKIDLSNPVPGIPEAFVDKRVTDAINLYAEAGWELISTALGGVEDTINANGLHALLIFRQEMR